MVFSVPPSWWSTVRTLVAASLGLCALVFAQEQTRQTRPPVTEVPSAQLPEKYRNQPRPVVPDPPSMRYEQLRNHAAPRIVLPTLDPAPYIEEDRRARKNRELK